MAEDFKTIETQEEFNERIKDRLDRERSTISRQFEDQIKKAEADRDAYKNQVEGFQTSAKENAEKITDLETKLEEANKKAAGLELENLRTQVAIEKGLPMTLKGRLNGATKEELEADADSLKNIFRTANNRDIPGFTQTEGRQVDEKKAEMKKMVSKLRKGE